MKAIVMAGGEGTRLRPITCCVPKPMVRLLDKPLTEYTVEHLIRHGIRDMAFTLMYMPNTVIEYFEDYKNANIEYFIEDEPLGTAGSVKNASAFIQGENHTAAPFLVISGDALCDIDISEAALFHERSGAKATIVLKKIGVPLEYGVVISDDDGSVERFLEKPGWEDVFSDTVNTGIYILSPEVLDMIPEHEKFDFAKDLFPLMMREKIPVSGYVTEGYWCDVGNIGSYIKAHGDLLGGRVKADIKGKRAAGIYVGDGAKISGSARLQAPCFIGEGAEIGEGAMIGRYTSVGRGARVGGNASIMRSVLLEDAGVGRNTRLSGCVVAKGASVGERCCISEGAVIGERCNLSGSNTVSPHVRIWPEKWLSAGAAANGNIVWGYGERTGFLGKVGFAGDIGADLTPLRLGRIFGAAAEFMSGKSVALSSDGTAYGDAVLKQAAGIFMQSGADVYSISGVPKPVCAHAAELLGAGLCVSIKAQKRIKLYVDLFEPDIFILSKNARKKIEAKYFAQGEQMAQKSCGKEMTIGAAEKLYLNSLRSGIDTASIKNSKLRVLVRGGKNVDAFAARALKECGVTAKQLETDLSLPIKGLLRDESASFAVRMSRNASFCSLYLQSGRVLGRGDFETLAYYLIFSSVGGGSVSLPSGVSRSAVSIAEVMGLEVKYVSHEEALRSMSQSSRRMLSDGVYALCRLSEHIARTGITIEEIAAMIEPEHKRVREINCGWDDIGRVIKEVYREGATAANEGLRLDVENGYGYICPHSTHPKIIVRTEGFTEEYAEELCEKYTDMVKKIINK